MRLGEEREVIPRSLVGFGACRSSACWRVEVGTRCVGPPGCARMGGGEHSHPATGFWKVWLRNRDKHAIPTSLLMELMLPVKPKAKCIILPGEAEKTTFCKKRWAPPPPSFMVGIQLPRQALWDLLHLQTLRLPLFLGISGEQDGCTTAAANHPMSDPAGVSPSPPAGLEAWPGVGERLACACLWILRAASARGDTKAALWEDRSAGSPTQGGG